jgi:tRNA 2-thiouridine synthesizing protein E
MPKTLKHNKARKSPDKVFVSTGSAAKLLSVSADTVLRWIKQGKLPARKTFGGHYRISRASIESMLKRETGPPPGVEGKDSGTFLYCWEYNSLEGKLREECRSCLVYQVRGSRCYEISEQLRQMRRGASYCSTACEECAYFKDQKRRQINILVITDNEELKNSLMERAMLSRYNVRFTSCEYECSAIVDNFRPEYVVMDCTMDWQKRQELCFHLATDPRIPEIKIILAVSADRKSSESSSGSLLVAGQPFTFKDMENYVENYYSLQEIQEGGDESMEAQVSQITGAELNADGFLVQLSQWDSKTAEELAKANGIWPLTEYHWMIIEFVQRYYKEHNTGPPVVRISEATGLSMRQICELFPCGVVKGAYRLAGLPRPPGCA